MSPFSSFSGKIGSCKNKKIKKKIDTVEEKKKKKLDCRVQQNIININELNFTEINIKDILTKSNKI